MNIRPATPHHLDGVLRLEDEFAPKQRWSEATWRRELANPMSQQLIAADDADGAVIGAAVFRLGDDVVDVDRVVVAPHCRRRGVARALLRRGVGWARQRGATRLLLEVDESNHPAARLYQDHGFRSIARRRDYYGAGHDALIMESVLMARRDGFAGAPEVSR